jgi:HSP20 family protein
LSDNALLALARRLFSLPTEPESKQEIRRFEMTGFIVRKNRNGIEREINRMFDHFFSVPSFAGSSACCFSPSVDISESADSVSLTFELPGMDKKDIKVMVENNVLTVSGKRESHRQNKDESYLVSEINSGEFSRSFTLPDYLDTEKIKADYKNGMLTIKLDRLEEKKPKEIEIKIS